MEMAMTSWMLAIPLLGIATGLRTMTGMAVFCWFAYLVRMPVHQNWAFWTPKLVTVILFTVFAIGEYVGDKLPKTPSRTSAFPLAARLIFGGLVGALAATALRGAVLEGIILGSLGALLGAFAGHFARHELVERTKLPDWVVAVCEDAVAILLAVFAMRVITS